MLSTRYTLQETYSVVRDTPEHLDFHAKHGDYLALIATLMGFIEDILHESVAGTVTQEMQTRQASVAKELREDLKYLNAHYDVVPKVSN